MSTEITNTDPLCWILDNEWHKYYKKCELSDLQKARNNKLDILCEWDIILTHFQISKYWKADTIDRFIFFSLPSYPAEIKRRFKNAIENLPDYRKKTLTYDQISQTVKRWREEDEYYSQSVWN